MNQKLDIYQYKNNLFSEKYFKDSELELLIKHASSESDVLELIELTHICFRKNQLKKSPISSLIDFVSQSNYSLEEWIKGIIYFSNYLKENNRERDLQVMLGYIECSTRSPDNLVLKRDLVLIIDEMILTYGYNG